MASKPGRGSDQFPLRLPDGMRERIREAADQNDRSMNAEIIARLEQSFSAIDPEVVDDAKAVVRDLVRTEALKGFDLAKVDAMQRALEFLSGAPSRAITRQKLNMVMIENELGALDGPRSKWERVFAEEIEHDLAKIAKYMKDQGWQVEPPDRQS